MALSFTSLGFVVFLGLCLGLLHAARRTSVRKWLLIVYSFLFYVSFGIAGVVVLAMVALVDFVVGRRLETSTSDATRARWLCLGIAGNLAPLVAFKYARSLLQIAGMALAPIGTHVAIPGVSVFQIVGLSYFTFAGLSYVLDVHRGTTEPARNFSEFMCYLVYFPKLLAGPVARAADFLPQLHRGFRVTARDVEIGFTYFLVGAVKKLVIADQLSSHVGMIFAAPQHYNAFTLVQGIVGYSVQIYADFSGYSDMAIGCARLMGIELPQNFLMPYSSVNIAEFWRRWHVTMSSWFRDYVFLPLEVSGRHARNPTLRASCNMGITMILCGLWHGASWNFVFWGGLHGLALAVYKIYRNRMQGRALAQPRSGFHPLTLISRVATLSVITLGWVFFGTQTLAGAFQYLERMVTWNQDGIALGSPYILPLTALVVFAHLFTNKDKNMIDKLTTLSMPVRVGAYASLLLALVCLVPSDAIPFTYVRF